MDIPDGRLGLQCGRDVVNMIKRTHWSYEGSPDSHQLRIFGMIGLKQDEKAYLGPSPEQLFEVKDRIGADISEKSANFHDSHGLSQIRLNSHTALLLFCENVLSIEILTAAQENEDSILARLFGVPVIIQENPEFAIAYYNHSGLLIAA